MVSVDDQTEFSDVLVSEWILNRIFNDATALDALSESNDFNWYSDYEIGILVTLVVNYYRKHHAQPTRDAIIGNLQYLAEKGRLECDLPSVIARFAKTVDQKVDIDDETLKDSIELFVKKNGMYQSFMKFMDAKTGSGKSSKKVSFDTTFREIQQFSEFKIDNDVGMVYFDDFDKHLQFIQNPSERLPTGIEWIDKVTNGGIYRYNTFMGVIQAAPCVGKSLMLSQFAYQSLLLDRTVLIITCEMSDNAYARRIDALIAKGCNIDLLGAQHRELEQKVRKFHEEHPNAKLIIKEYASGKATTFEIRNYIENLIRDGVKPDLIVIDYLNLLKTTQGGRNDQLFIKIGYISKEVRAISHDLHIPIMTATQSNRAAYTNSEVRLDNISQSTALAEDGDFICGLYQMDEDVDNGVIKVNVIKNRLGNKNYTPHQFKIDSASLDLIDMGDATGNDDAEDATSVVASRIAMKGMPKGEPSREFAKPVIESNATSSPPLSCEDMGFSDIF